MQRKEIAVITGGGSDLLEILQESGVKTRVIKPEEVRRYDLNAFHAIAILGGTSDQPLIFHPGDRVKIEEQIAGDKKVFCEYCGSITNLYYPEPTTTRFERLAFCWSDEIEGLEQGDLLDDQCNVSLRPYDFMCAKTVPILQYMNVNAHRKTEITADSIKNVSDRGLWFERPGRLLICSFRMCNFVKARFAPRDKWKSLAAWILQWLCGEKISLDGVRDAYHVKPFTDGQPFSERLMSCIGDAMGWFEDSGMLLNHGRGGVLEGIATEIYPDGNQRILKDLRNDCTGEASLAFFMYFLLTGDRKYMQVSDDLISVCFDLLQDKSDTYLKGMMRWSKTQWGVCYQDDVARAVIPQLLKCLYTGTRNYLSECTDALEFLVKTTGSDGTRVSRTDNVRLSPEEMNRLASQPGNFPCVHHNGYYYAALLLAYQLTGVERFKDTAIKGFDTIMGVYPDTIREHSETQELCRLILPLSWLYWVTGREEHKTWLYRVTRDLMRFYHPSGGFLEWDTGYKAHRCAASDTGECSLLSQNGDPISDLLYSMNWLPIGFMQAYFVTGDRLFRELWEGTAKFMISSQIHSIDKKIHGAWARAFDVELKEIYGMPKDAGWGPCVIESGWTVAEIAAGLAMGLLQERLVKHYREASG